MDLETLYDSLCDAIATVYGEEPVRITPLNLRTTLAGGKTAVGWVLTEPNIDYEAIGTLSVEHTFQFGYVGLHESDLLSAIVKLGTLLDYIPAEATFSIADRLINTAEVPIMDYVLIAQIKIKGEL